MGNWRLFRYLLTFVLIVLIVAVIGFLIVNYNMPTREVYTLDETNLISDGSFENFNKTAGDCCNTNPNASRVYAFKSEDSIIGSYSLNLTSEYQCACSSFPVVNFDKYAKYLLSFYYKGDNPKFCNWANGKNKCLPVKFVNPNEEWTRYNEILLFDEQSLSSSIYLYADSRDGKTHTNLYDALEFHKLIPIENPKDYKYNPEEEYIFKTKTNNNIHNAEMISEIDKKTAEAYYITKGKPNITIKFPWSEVVIVTVMLLIVVRLLFKKQILKNRKKE